MICVLRTECRQGLCSTVSWYSLTGLHHLVHLRALQCLSVLFGAFYCIMIYTDDQLDLMLCVGKTSNNNNNNLDSWYDMATELSQEIGRCIISITEDTMETTLLLLTVPLSIALHAVSFGYTMVTE